MSLLSGEVLHQLSRDQLVHVLETIHGMKDLYIDPLLMKPLDRIAGASLLRWVGHFNSEPCVSPC